MHERHNYGIISMLTIALPQPGHVNWTAQHHHIDLWCQWGAFDVVLYNKGRILYSPLIAYMPCISNFHLVYYNISKYSPIRFYLKIWNFDVARKQLKCTLIECCWIHTILISVWVFVLFAHNKTTLLSFFCYRQILLLHKFIIT